MRKRRFDDNGKSNNINSYIYQRLIPLKSKNNLLLLDVIIKTLFSDGGFRSKKRRTSENVEIEDRLESLILRVGEKVIISSKFRFKVN